VQDELYDHVIGHLDRLDSALLRAAHLQRAAPVCLPSDLAAPASADVLDERAADLEERARRLEELSRDNSRDARRLAQSSDRRTVEGSITYTLTKAREDARRTTAAVSAAMTDGMNSVLGAAPTPVQQFAAQVDRVFAPLHEATRSMLGVPRERPSSFKGRRTMYSDVVGEDAGLSSGGAGQDNFEPISEVDGTLDEPAPAELRKRRDN